MENTPAPAMEAFAAEMLEDMNRRDAEDQEEIRKIQGRIRERGVVKNHIMHEYGSGTGDQGLPDTELDGCPLTGDEMRRIGNRQRILEEIASRSPGGRIRSMAAARWMRAADIIKTNPENVSKSLAMHMRRNPATWHAVAPGQFQLIDTDETPDQIHDGGPKEEQGGPVEQNQGGMNP
jgi:hypothetical protein